MAFSIHVVDYVGDLDSLNEINLIGPFDTVQERDAMIDRLSALPDMRGDYEFHPSTLDPANGCDLVATPEAAAKITDGEDIWDAYTRGPNRHR